MKAITDHLPKLRVYMDYVTGASANLLGVVCNFLIQLVLIRAIGVASFGQFAVWRNNVLLAGSLGTLSINSMLVKTFSALRGSGDHKATLPLHRKSTVIVIFASILFAIGIGVLLTPDDISLSSLLIGSVLYAVLVLWASSARALFGGRLTLFAERAIQPVLFLAGSIIFIAMFRQNSLEEFSWLYVASLIVTIALVRTLSRSKSRTDLDSSEPRNTSFEGLNDGYRNILKSSTPFFLISIATYASNRLPLLVGGQILDGYSLGQLAFMQSLAGLVIAVLFSFNMIAGPKISQAFHNGDTVKACDEVRKMLFILVPLGILTNVLIFLSVPVTEIILDDIDLVPRGVFAMFLMGSYIYAIFTAPSIFLQMTGHEKRLAQVTNVAFLLKLIIIVPLAQRYGLMGFAIAQLAQTSAIGLAVTTLYLQAYKRLMAR
ncbi:MAG: lipopolysaccharide biosynthesis protein [Alphaproteobacteria bacterium]|nr:MAG: lipopolysaccharide biosynthesis protein [Alphaproteobacteria bacterium]